ncbi:MAG: PHP domain-containing protein [Anaerolineae bacterium]|nr:PHP domain-containing protein [Anaerolineae bacterium]
MKIDMHVHTDRYSNCGKMSPEAMAQAAIERGLDGVVMTEHNTQWSLAESQALQMQFPALKILRGIEVSAAEGHALVYGVSDSDTLAFYPEMPIAQLARFAHAAGGIVMLAHPARYEETIPSAVYHAGIDGVELFSMNIRLYMESAIQGLERILAKPGIAGTDAHAVESLGFYATDFHYAIYSEQDLVRAVQARAFTVYCDLERVRAYNRQLDGQVAQMQRLAHENTLAEREIRAHYQFSWSFQRGVRKGQDMHLRICSITV